MATSQPDIRTTDHPRGAWVLIAFFIALLAFVPAAQLAVEIARHEPIQELDVLKQTPTLQHFQSFERALEDNSVVAEMARKHCQWIGLVALHAGNREALMGRGDWMYYRTSLDSVTAHGFMDDPQAEGHPLDAILRFDDALDASGVELVLLIVPGKEKIYPEWLSRRAGKLASAPTNEDMDAFLAALDDAGTRYLNPTELLWNAKGGSLVADELGRMVAQPTGPQLEMRVEALAVSNRGDLHDMLELADLPSPREPQAVTVQRIVHADTGEPIEPDMDSPIVLLGDSFTNVFSVGDMGWGDYAGLGEQLAYRLGRPIDIIAQNDGGVNTARATLARRPGGLTGKQVVIWQFAARDLVVSNGEWKRIEIASR